MLIVFDRPNAEGQELQSLFWIGLKKTTDEKAAWIKATFPTQDNPISLEDEPLSSSDNPYEKGLRKDERVHLRLLLFGKSTEHALSKAEGRYYADFAGFWFNPKGRHLFLTGISQISRDCVLIYSLGKDYGERGAQPKHTVTKILRETSILYL